MSKRSILKCISFLIILFLCLNLYQPVTHAEDSGSGGVKKLSMKLDLNGFSTYQENNYVFEFGQDTGYESARDIWIACIKKGFTFKLDAPVSNADAFLIGIGITTYSEGSFSIGEDKFPKMKLNYKGGSSGEDWTFEEVYPDTNYYERFTNTDSQGNVTTVVINDINADYYQGNNFKQVFLKGMKVDGGAKVESDFLEQTDNAEYYKLTATIGNDTFEYKARITTNCNHSSTKTYKCDHKTHVDDYIIDYLKENKLDQKAYADYCVDICNDCGKPMSVHLIDTSGESGQGQGTGESGEGQESGQSGEEGGTNLPSGSGENQESGESGKNKVVGEPVENQKSVESGAVQTVVSQDNKAAEAAVTTQPATHNDEIVSTPYIKFSKKSYKIKKGKTIKIKYKSLDVDYKKLKVKASKKGCISIKKVTKSYILIKANKKASLNITLKYKTKKANATIKIY